MIDFDTTYFILKVQELASRSKYGIFPFSKANSEQAMSGILYDDSPKYKETYPIVECFLIDEIHGHDLIANSEEDKFYKENNIEINVYLPEEDNMYPWIEVTSSKMDYSIVIENGEIYLA